jgi:ferredoxin
MAVMEKSALLDFLEGQSQKAWIDALDEIGPSIHPVDRRASRIWFAFWPLELQEALSSPEGAEEMARLMDLEGNWRLDKQIDSAVSFLYGAHYWAATKRVILSLDEGEVGKGSLAAVIRRVGKSVAESDRVDEALTLGISAVGLMILRQVGVEAFERIAPSPAAGPLVSRNPERVLAHRERKSGGLLSFIKGVNRTWEVRWEEREPHAVFHAINGQDIAMAGASDQKDYRARDYRRIDGPVPVECRVGSCGYCWVGVLAGHENVSEMTEFERERLRYFGYDKMNGSNESQPLVRLACQSQCHGDVTLTIPPWNGELNRRHNEGPKKLGTV